MDSNNGNDAQIKLTTNKKIEVPFTDAASLLVIEKSSENFTSLITESINVGKRDRTDVISAKHVQIAANNLVSHSRGTLYAHLGIWGGIFLGASLSALLSMILANQYPALGVILVTIVGIFGAYLLGKSP